MPGDTQSQTQPPSHPETIEAGAIPLRPRLPHVDTVQFAPLRKSAAVTVTDAAATQTPIYEMLVQHEHDVIGLLAYALYKQNKRDWFVSMQAVSGREPTTMEIDAYGLSERLPRRIAAYRKLAEDMLEKHRHKPEASQAASLAGQMMHPANGSGRMLESMAQDVKATENPMTGSSGEGMSKNAMILRTLCGMLLLVVGMAILFRFAGIWLFGTPGR
ncbi:MAG: hypothetical protein ACKVON_11795 [Beijerinckiaceae bacterium]